MRKAVRAIIINDNKLLVMHRNKFGEEYDTLPGGNIEVGETPEQALWREVEEETMVIFSDPSFIAVEHSGDPYGDQYIYLCKYVSGEPQLHPDAEEQAINKMGKNLYNPTWVAINELSEKPFVSRQLKEFILLSVKDGWPKSAVEITTNV